MTGWGFGRRTGAFDTFDGAFLLHLGPTPTALNLSTLLSIAPALGDAATAAGGSGGSSSGWELSGQWQPGGATTLLANMSSVVRRAIPVPPSTLVVTVPAFSVLRLEWQAAA